MKRGRKPFPHKAEVLNDLRRGMFIKDVAAHAPANLGASASPNTSVGTRRQSYVVSVGSLVPLHGRKRRSAVRPPASSRGSPCSAKNYRGVQGRLVRAAPPVFASSSSQLAPARPRRRYARGDSPRQGSMDYPGQQTALIYVGIILLLVLSLIGGLEVLIEALT